jgi:hypothetical protein
MSDMMLELRVRASLSYEHTRALEGRLVKLQELQGVREVLVCNSGVSCSTLLITPTCRC